MSETEPEEIQREIAFTSGDFHLKGVLHLPAGEERPPVVIGSHGLFSSSSSPKQVQLARDCAAAGIAFFRFDHRGCGASEGNFRDVTGFEARCSDLLSAVKIMKEQKDLGGQTALFGSSLGGAVCLNVFKKAGVSALVTFAAPLRSAPVLKALEKSEDPNFKDINPAALQFDLSAKIAGLHHILIFHGDSDKVVPPSEAHRLYQKAVLPKRIIMLRNGDHRMSRQDNQEKFFREAVEWYRRWLLEKQSA
ncbi:MAG: alpha/beta fold hydrolase [Desulfobacterales bacterium]